MHLSSPFPPLLSVAVPVHHVDTRDWLSHHPSTAQQAREIIRSPRSLASRQTHQTLQRDGQGRKGREEVSTEGRRSEARS